MKQKIKVIGFDLDNTLYKPNEAINERILTYACQKASELLNEPYTVVREKFNLKFSQTQSGSQSLEFVGVEDPKSLMQEALEYADIASALERDESLISLFSLFSKRYHLFLITSSNENMAIEKLQALGILLGLFDIRFYAGSRYKREDGSIFSFIAKRYAVSFEEILFVGDREQTDILPAKEQGVQTAIVHGTSKHADYALRTIYDLETIV